MLLRATGEFMGWAGLKLVSGPINGHHNFYDIGYRFRPAFWGRGYGYEAAQAWLTHGFETLKAAAHLRVCQRRKHGLAPDSGQGGPAAG